MRLRAILNLTRLHTASWESLIFVLGALVVGEPFVEPQVLFLWLLGLLINSFIFVLNDLADLPRDRLDPSKQSSPLVRGDLSTSFALFLACVLPIVMWLAIAIARWPAAAEISFATLLLLGALLCVYQKNATRVHPLLLDVLFGVTMAGPIPVGIVAVSQHIPLYAWTLAAGFMVLCVALNVVGGNLKDLAADHASGFRTTALAMGVRPMANGRVDFSTGYRCFLYAVGSATCCLVFATAMLSWDGESHWLDALTAAGVAALLIGLMLSIHRLASGRTAPAPRGREPFFVYGMAAILLTAASYASVPQLSLALSVSLVWEYGFRIYWNSPPHSRLADTECRPSDTSP